MLPVLALYGTLERRHHEERLVELAPRSPRDLARGHDAAAEVQDQEDLAPRGVRQGPEDDVPVLLTLPRRPQACQSASGRKCGKSSAGLPSPRDSTSAPIGSHTAMTSGEPCARPEASSSRHSKISTKCGPWPWSSQPIASLPASANPAALTSAGKPRYSCRGRPRHHALIRSLTPAQEVHYGIRHLLQGRH